MVMRAIVAVAMTLWLFGSVRAEEPVHFADLTLKMLVEDELWVTDPTPTDMLGLISLDATARNVSRLTGLEHATNLRALYLARCPVSDVSPLSGLAGLETLVLNNSQISDISPLSGLSGLTYLDIHENAISNISSLGSLINLRYLDIHDNQVSDISALAGLHNLETAVLRINGIRDISPLAGLTHLETVYLEDNRIRDISALASLSNLQNLNLSGNEITDISPLVGLTSFLTLDVRANPWTEEACNTYIPQIVAQNPGLHILDNCGPFVVSISSTAGGSVIDPGEGLFTYQYGDELLLEARADPGFVFNGWSGTHTGTLNPTVIVVRQDHEIQATFISTRDMIHVDDDALDDPGPNDPRLSDPHEDGSREHPFDGIQEAIDVATDGTTIFVHPGTYHECIDFLGKQIELTGFNPEDANAPAWPVITGGSGPIVSFTRGERQNCILGGVVVTGGTGRLVGAVRCVGSSPTIRNCLIVGNRAMDSDGAVIDCKDSNAVFVNCTVADNRAGKYSAAVHLTNARVTMVNSILWGNTPKEILFDGEFVPSVRHTTVAGGWPGRGNLSVDPLFVDPGHWAAPGEPEESDAALGLKNPGESWIAGDYHLQSQVGHWDSRTGVWVRDLVTSPCIDAGAPDTPPGHEPLPNGGVIDMGVFGGTTEASKSPSGGFSP